jgi:hypothetical protein
MSTPARNLVVLALATLAALAGLAMLLARPASAFEGYGLPTYFGSTGSGPGQLSKPAGVAVNDTSKEVYVYDSGNLRVERFDATGTQFEGQFNGTGSPTGQFAPPASVSEDAAHGTLFNLAVDNAPTSPSKGDIYVVDPGHNVIDKFTATGTYLSQLTGFKLPIFGVAVDSSGDVWVAEEGRPGGKFGEGPVQHFDNATVNNHVTELTPIGLRSPGIALDTAENLYLLQSGQNVSEFNKEGGFVETLTGCGCGTALAVDSSSNDLFVDEGKSISRFPPGIEFGQPPTETLTGISGSDGVAVNSATHAVYASGLAANSVAVFSFGLLPDVTTGSASEVTRTTAKLEGEVNPDGQEVTSCQFEYGPTAAYGKTVPCSALPGSGTEPVAVSAEATGLTAGATNHFRLVAGYATGRHAGSDAELTTLPAVENVETESAVAVTAHTATLQGSFEPNGLDTHYQFEVRVIGGATFFTALQDAGSASEVVHVSSEVTGLPPNTFVLFRLIAENSLGRTIGNFGFLKTPIIAPVILGAPSATFIAAQSADLGASLNPEHTTTHYHFEYGACPTLAGCAGIHSTPEETSGVFGEIGASSEISGLTPATTYSYRLVAVNEFEAEGETQHETTLGPEATFTTPAARVPSVQTGASAVLGTTSAQVSGSVEPNGVPTSYSFELGIYNGAVTQYGVVAGGSAGSTEGAVPVSASINGLQPGTTYAYRLSISSGYITNETHSLTGATGLFTTPGLAAALSVPPVLAQLPIPSIAFPKEAAKVVTPKKLTRAQKLKNALKACHKLKGKKRASCIKSAHKRYGPAKKRK